MATIEARGYVNKLEHRISSGGKEYVKFDLAVQQKRKEKGGNEVVEKLYFRCVDFDPKGAPADGEYVGVTGYVTLTKWEGGKEGKGGINIDVTVKSYEKLEQKARKDGGGGPGAAAGKAEPPPEDPFALSPGKP